MSDHLVDSAFFSRETGFARDGGFQCKVECGPMPNVMVALSNIGGALCSTPQRLADAHYYSAVQ